MRTLRLLAGALAATAAIATLSAADTTASAATGDPVIAAAGDIACSSNSARSSTRCRQIQTSDLLVDGGYAAVLPLGDEQYPCGSLTDFRKYYAKSWGRVAPITYPVVGDNEYVGSTCSTPGASGYFTYFGKRASPLDTNCTSSCKGYYSYNVGAWHLVALNTECNAPGVGGCSSTSPQTKWLKADLAAHPTRCTLAYFHRPRWGQSQSNASSTFAKELYKAGAEIILSGHSHVYLRFAPQNASGGSDPVKGIRQFVVGTGGYGLGSLKTALPNTQFRYNTRPGILELQLSANSYTWRFKNDAGTVIDSGTTACH